MMAAARLSSSSTASVANRLFQKRPLMIFRYILGKSFSTESGKDDYDDVPEDFFNPKVELEKEFLDVVSAVDGNGGLSTITSVQKPLVWEQIQDAIDNPLPFKDFREDLANVVQDANPANATLSDDFEAFDNYDIPQVKMVNDALIDKDLADHLQEFETSYIPPAMLNYNIPWKKSDVIDHQANPEKYPFETLQDNFLPKTESNRFMHDAQGLKHCPGKRQRKGKKADAQLECHLIDLETLSYIDVLGLRRWLADDAEIMPRKVTGLCAKCQRKVAKNIKRSRNFGLLPHLGEFLLQDSNPVSKADNFHTSVSVSGEYKITKIVNGRTKA